jgi:hypothetical protein
MFIPQCEALGEAPDYSDKSLISCSLTVAHAPAVPARDELLNMISLVRIDHVLPYIARRVTSAFGYNRA